jgi:hypothetical protein
VRSKENLSTVTLLEDWNQMTRHGDKIEILAPFIVSLAYRIQNFENKCEKESPCIMEKNSNNSKIQQLVSNPGTISPYNEK